MKKQKLLEWRVERRKLSDLIPSARNPRKISTERLAKLKEHIVSEGYRNPINIDENNVLLAGHQRLKVLTELANAGEGDIEIYVMVPPKELIPLSPALRKKIIASDNISWGVDDWEILKQDYTEVELLDYGYEDLQWENEEQKERPVCKIFAAEEICAEAFKIFRKRGFPYPNHDKFELMIELNRLANTPHERCLSSTVGYMIADNYHKHRFEAAAYKMKSPVKAYAEDKSLKKALSFHFEETGKLEYKRFGFLNLVNGVQACANFRPAFAKRIYDQYAENGIVFDSSTGYGGRLVGFLASSAKQYIGTDPNTPTYQANVELVKDLGVHKKVTLYNDPIEDLNIKAHYEKCDFAFTSPPYFMKEIYSKDDTQSCNRYPEIDAWVSGFLVKMLQKQFAVLKKGATNIVNIEDVKIDNKKYNLVEATIEQAKKVGFKYVKTEKFKLPNRTRLYDDEKVSEASSESVLVFKK